MRLGLVQSFLLVVSIAVATPLVAQQAAETAVPKRVALVIGNSNYESEPLENPANDAELVARSLRSIGFTVTMRLNRTKFEMESDIDAVTADLRSGDAVFIYFAGHGLQLKNTNYLVPIDAVVTREFHVAQRCVEAEYLIAAMEDSGASLRVVVLDACRNNPFRSFTRSSKKGLAAVEAPEGTIIAYSTSPGSVALDGSGKNSPFAKHMAETIDGEYPYGLEIANMFAKVARAVRKETGQRAFVTRDVSMDPFFLKPAIASRENPISGGSKTVQPFESYYDLEDFELVRKHAELGFAEAQAQLGHLYSEGIGTDIDEAQAFQWYQKAAAQGSARAMSNLSLLFEEGKVVKKDLKESVRLCRLAASKGYPLAKYNMGVNYENGTGVEKDFVQAAHWYQAAARMDRIHPNDRTQSYAQYNLGILYSNGTGVEKDDSAAVKLYRLSAEQGYDMAQCQLGVMYANGTGVEKDEAEAVKWYRLSADQGFATAQYNLGYALSNGIGVTQDESEAVKWYRKAAEQGDGDAQNAMGIAYDNGTGVNQDSAEAVNWYRKGAEQGNADSQNNLGVAYESGTGVKQDFAEAVKWYRKSAEQEQMFAQFNLGRMFQNGTGVPRDIDSAKRWYQKSAQQGFQGAEQELENLVD